MEYCVTDDNLLEITFVEVGNDDVANPRSLLLGDALFEGVQVMHDGLESAIFGIAIPVGSLLLKHGSALEYRYTINKSIIYIRTRRGWTQEYSVESDNFNENIMVDFDKNDRIIGIAILNVGDWLPAEYLDNLPPDWDIINPVNEDTVLPVTPKKVKKVRTDNHSPKKKKKEYVPLSDFLEHSRHGDLELLIPCIQEDPELINDRDRQGSSALLLAASFGHLDIVKYLIEELGCNIHDQRTDGSTCILRAASRGHTELVQWLLENGANILDRDRCEDTSAMHASAGGHLETLKLLQEYGSDVKNERSSSGSNCLIRAASRGQVHIVKWLVEQGVSLNDRTSKNKQALHYAARNANIKTVKYLVESGADTSSMDSSGMNALDCAIKGKNQEIIEYLSNVCT
eukprot:TRINITY_DN2077_c0_g1_i2.p1 TRINITY_DN2077_c0_g1~~TRINITY_DN2077_c0_g1_i2.p1  ORF type:complete len:400 (+),score=74.93 TRINITY_DN2077_c0_g1_i2:80-1279(+)